MFQAAITCVQTSGVELAGTFTKNTPTFSAAMPARRKLLEGERFTGRLDEAGRKTWARTNLGLSRIHI